MLPTKLSRAAQRATASPPTATCYACLAKQRTHQRRHSSSKTSSSSSSPADNRYSNKPAGPSAKATTPAPVDGEQSTPAIPEAKSPSRTSKGRTRLPRRSSGGSGHDAAKKAVPVESEERFTKLPSVPSVQNLSESGMSSIHSFHEPLHGLSVLTN